MQYNVGAEVTIHRLLEYKETTIGQPRIILKSYIKTINKMNGKEELQITLHN